MHTLHCNIAGRLIPYFSTLGFVLSTQRQAAEVRSPRMEFQGALTFIQDHQRIDQAHYKHRENNVPTHSAQSIMKLDLRWSMTIECTYYPELPWIVLRMIDQKDGPLPPCMDIEIIPQTVFYPCRWKLPPRHWKSLQRCQSWSVRSQCAVVKTESLRRSASKLHMVS